MLDVIKKTGFGMLGLVVIGFIIFITWFTPSLQIIYGIFFFLLASYFFGHWLLDEVFDEEESQPQSEGE